MIMNKKRYESYCKMNFEILGDVISWENNDSGNVISLFNISSPIFKQQKETLIYKSMFYKYENAWYRIISQHTVK